MNVEFLARLQFSLTIMFHYIFPPMSIGLGLILVIIESSYLRTGKTIYKEMARFWTRIFALTFALGVATGVVMEFQFGTNWATYSRFVGDVFGSALAAEGVFAFFLESGFLAILLFGWDRVGPKTHFFSTLMVCLGAHFSAIWIVVANSWMQTPAGYMIEGKGLHARAIITDFWAMVFNPSSMVRLAHVVVGAWLVGAFLVVSISAYYLLKKRHIEFSNKSIKVALWVALVSLILQGVLGDQSGRIAAKYQPSKIAAFEGIYKTQKEAPLSLFGISNAKTETVDYAVNIPYMLSFLIHHDPHAEVIGLDKFPKEDWPSPVVFQTYHLMLYMWGIMLILTILGIWKFHQSTLADSKGSLWLLIFSVFLPQVANQAGWVSTEMGRYPWIVHNHLRIADGLSKSVVASQVLGSIIMFGILYIILFILFIYLLNEKIQHGPLDNQQSTPYPQHRTYVKEIQHDIT